MNKASCQEEQRLAVLRSYEILDTAPEPLYDSLTDLAAHLLNVPMAAISLVDSDRQWFKSRKGLVAREAARCDSICSLVVEQGQQLVLEDARLHPRAGKSRLVLGDPHIRFYAGVPLTMKDGQIIGVLAVADTVPRTIALVDELVLARLAAQVVALLESRREHLQLDRERPVLETQRRFFDVTLDLMCTLDEDLWFRELNPAWERALGWSWDELRLKPSYDWIHPEDRERARTLLSGALTAADGFFYLENRYAHRDGHWVPIRWTICARDGALYASGRDLSSELAHETEILAHQTALIDQQAQLAESEARLRGVFDAMAEGVVVQDAEGGIVSCNPAASHILGLTPEDLLGRSGHDVLWPLSNHDIDGVESGHPPVGHSFSTGQATSGVVRSVLRPDGKRIWANINAQPLVRRAGEPPYAVVATVRDTTEQTTTRLALEHAESSLRAIIDTAIDAIITVNGLGVVERANPAVLAMFGYLPQELVGHNVRMLFADSVSKHSSLMIGEEAPPSGRIHACAREILGRRRDGTTFHVEVTLSEFQVLGETKFTGILRDVSERKRIEEELRDLSATAERANMAKTEFLANMSHEIRTPMNAIVGMGELLADTPLNAKQLSYVHNLRTAGEHLLDVINDVLDVAKIEAGKMTLERTPFTVREMAEDVCDVLATRVARDVELVCHVGEDVGGEVLGDSIRLRQVVFNLVGNAIKFTKRGEVLLDIVRDKSSPKLYHFRVTDTGVGIPADRLDAIFESFTQADNSTTRTYGGTGLGLTISKAIVEKMGGKLEVSSRVGSGSTFSFSLELDPGEAAAEESSASIELFAGASALVVSPSGGTRNVVREAFDSFEVVVSEASSTEEALGKARRAAQAKRGFSFVVLDASYDGVSLAEQLSRERLAGADCAIILIHRLGNELPGDDEKRALGIRAVVAKPLRRVELRKALASAVKAEVKPVASISANAPEPPPPEVGESFLPLSILVADDVAINRELVAAHLEAFPFRLTFAEDGRVASSLASKGDYDLIFMDIQMPNLDGYAATRAIRMDEATKGRARTPIVAMTAHAMQEEVARCIAAGCDGHFAKPINRKGLLATIRTFARKPEGALAAVQAAPPGFTAAVPVVREPVPCAPVRSRASDGAGPGDASRGTSEVRAVLHTTLPIEPSPDLPPAARALVPRYLASCRAQLAELQRAANDADYLTIHKNAHVLKGSGEAFGFPAFSSLGQRLEIAAAVNDDLSVRTEVELFRRMLGVA
jgi:two-component system sensor histidine kinase/response regulator